MHIEFLAEMGKSIKERRELIGYNQKDLAELTKINEKTIRGMEQGKGSSKLEYWLKVMDVLGLKMSITIKPMSDETRKSLQ